MSRSKITFLLILLSLFAAGLFLGVASISASEPSADSASSEAEAENAARADEGSNATASGSDPEIVAPDENPILIAGIILVQRNSFGQCRATKQNVYRTYDRFDRVYRRLSRVDRSLTAEQIRLVELSAELLQLDASTDPNSPLASESSRNKINRQISDARRQISSLKRQRRPLICKYRPSEKASLRAITRFENCLRNRGLLTVT